MGDQILAVDDEVVVGYPVEKVFFQTGVNGTGNSSLWLVCVFMCWLLGIIVN